MAQGSRPERVGEEIRQEISALLAREIRDPGVGFVTLTRVKMSPDLQLARVYYTLIGDEKAKVETARALERVTPFIRRQIASRVRLRRVPEVRFEFDRSVEHQDRIERILLDLEQERQERGDIGGDAPVSASGGDPPAEAAEGDRPDIAADPESDREP
jgi:ribosome-binding factor A